ncbi:MAG: CFI-box-CTERM domain-containing protein [Enhygromyxa sp.]
MAYQAGKIGLFATGLALAVASADAAPPTASELEPAPGAEAEPSDDDEALLEFHFKPVDNLQIAIWLEDAEGNFVQDVFVTQATGKLGIANRPGLPLFLSSWRAPYGPREMVLPVWAHRRGKTYPKIIFHDANTNNHTSLGFHESSSSPETYFCRPLTPTEDAAIVDTMTCPSPATFQSDKGKFGDGLAPSVYPPRNDLTSFEDNHDHDHARSFADLNDLDAVTRATPKSGPYMIAQRIRRGDVPAGPLVAWIEVSLEWDENADWDFDREDDHWVDPKLPAYGREFLGQPAVVYRVEFDPEVRGFEMVSEYVGYADLLGTTGTLHPPDSTISKSGGSGADRLQVHEKFGVSGRFGVYNHGWGNAEPGDGDGDGDGEGGGGGGCLNTTLPPVEDLRIEPIAYNAARATFRLPEVPPKVELLNLYAHWITPETSNFVLSAATEASGIPRLCRDAGEVGCIDAGPGDEVSVDITQLFGNYTYTIGITYDDTCTNPSEVAFTDVTTPVQPFQTIDGACFVATAAWGAGWTEELRALRWFRDEIMLDQPIARDLVVYYYAYGPVLAGMIRDVPPARAASRLLLRPLARLARGLLAARD